MPPNTYQCIGGMVYAMCLISKAVVHQEDMMKREEHGERVKRTPMQSAQVLLVHTSYPPVLDGAKSVQRDTKFDFLALKTYKQWKPVDREAIKDSRLCFVRSDAVEEEDTMCRRVGHP
jgi:hypothetical protein